ncbi:MAG: hypothetical protein NWE92_03095 [Candidatus Bathyarchaeota archaeon]|nr:hypothetical protein [Candidatus Bathyarchaeota archaeon]
MTISHSESSKPSPHIIPSLKWSWKNLSIDTKRKAGHCQHTTPTWASFSTAPFCRYPASEHLVKYANHTF